MYAPAAPLVEGLKLVITQPPPSSSPRAPEPSQPKRASRDARSSAKPAKSGKQVKSAVLPQPPDDAAPLDGFASDSSDSSDSLDSPHSLDANAGGFGARAPLSAGRLPLRDAEAPVSAPHVAQSPASIRAANARHRPILLLVAIGAGLLTALGVGYWRRDMLAPLVSALQAQPSAAAQANEPLLALLVGAPLGVALALYLLGWQGLRLLRIAIYIGALRRIVRRHLSTYAPLYALGVAPTGVRFTAGGQPAAQGEEPVARLLARTPRAVLLGEAGAGKTTALYAYAATLTRRRDILAIFFGRAPLPILISLPGYALTPADANGLRLDAIASQVRRLSTPGLAARTPKLVRKGRAILLCDGFEEVPENDRPAVSASLSALTAPKAGAARMIVACQLATYLTQPDDLGKLRLFERIVLAPLHQDDMAQAVRRQRLPKRARSAAGGISAAPATPEAYLDEARNHLLDLSLTTPAIFVALLSTRANGRAIPYGRARLLYITARDLCERAANTNADAGMAAPDIARTLGALAASLQGARRACLPLTGAGGLGEQIANWLERYPPLAPTDLNFTETPTFDPRLVEAHAKAALRVGALKRQTDGLTLGFAHPLLQEAFAALWLSMQDDGLGRLNPELLRSHWVQPTLLWAGAKDDAADLAQRLFRFANSPDSMAPRFGLSDRQEVFPAALALSLAAVVEGATPQLTRLAATGSAHRSAFALTQQHLRDLLDQALIYCATPEAQARLARALQGVEHDAGPELITYIIRLIRLTPLDRLLRAQLITLLGLLSSETALAALMELLAETDPTLRQAVNQSLAYAGAAALAPLQQRLRDRRELIRTRAAEALTYISETTPDTADAALAAARMGLNSGDPRQRAAAAATLGSLRASEALESLIAALDDGASAVRVASARALGQIGGQRARAALRKQSAHADVALRVAVAQALANSPDPLSTPVLLQLLEDPEARVRTAAAMALGTLGDERAVGPLREHVADADPWAQNAAISALRRLGRG